MSGLAKKMLVCPACGSMDLQYESPVIGSVLPYYDCKSCRRRVMPIEFDSLQKAREFRQSKKGG